MIAVLTCTIGKVALAPLIMVQCGDDADDADGISKAVLIIMPIWAIPIPLRVFPVHSSSPRMARP
jgi:hypothetical protein